MATTVPFRYKNSFERDIVQACLRKDLQHLQSLLTSAPSEVVAATFNGFGDDQCTPLLVALGGHGPENIPMVDMLISFGADPNQHGYFDFHRTYPLTYAITDAQPDVALHLIRQTAVDPGVRDGKGSTALHYAATMGDFQIVKALLGVGVDASVREEGMKNTPLHQLGEPLLRPLKRDASIVQPVAQSQAEVAAVAVLLLERGAQVDATNQLGYTPLHKACITVRPALVRTLLHFGASAKVRTSDWWDSPLHCASQAWLWYAENHPYKACLGSLADMEEIAKMLLEAGAQVDLCSGKGRDGAALHKACEAAHIPIVRLLLAYKAKVSVKDSKGRTPLHYALLSPQLEAWQVIEPLVKAGADVNVPVMGLTPLGVAITASNLGAVREMLRLGARPNQATSSKGDLPLHAACKMLDLEMVQALLAADADPLRKDKKGTALALVHAMPAPPAASAAFKAWKAIRATLVAAESAAEAQAAKNSSRSKKNTAGAQTSASQPSSAVEASFVQAASSSQACTAQAGSSNQTSTVGDGQGKAPMQVKLPKTPKPPRCCARCGASEGAPLAVGAAAGSSGRVALKRCTGCRSVRYCSRDCQIHDWEDGHEQVCKALQAEMVAAVTSRSGTVAVTAGTPAAAAAAQGARAGAGAAGVSSSQPGTSKSGASQSVPKESVEQPAAPAVCSGCGAEEGAASRVQTCVGAAPGCSTAATSGGCGGNCGGDVVSLKHCTACRSVRYCSEVCQKAHWKAGHKVVCKELRTGKAAAQQP